MPAAFHYSMIFLREACYGGEHHILVFKKHKWRTEEFAWWLRALGPVPEDLGSRPALTWQLTTLYSPSPREHVTLSGLCGHWACTCFTDTDVGERPIHIKINQKFKKTQKYSNKQYCLREVNLIINDLEENIVLVCFLNLSLSWLLAVLLGWYSMSNIKWTSCHSFLNAWSTEVYYQALVVNLHLANISVDCIY